MARNDKYYESVKEALFKDGWTVTHDPFKVKVSKYKFKMDLGAESYIRVPKQERADCSGN
jgi:hypothetical protein